MYILIPVSFLLSLFNNLKLKYTVNLYSCIPVSSPFFSLPDSDRWSIFHLCCAVFYFFLCHELQRTNNSWAFLLRFVNVGSGGFMLFSHSVFWMWITLSDNHLDFSSLVLGCWKLRHGFSWWGWGVSVIGTWFQEELMFSYWDYKLVSSCLAWLVSHPYPRFMFSVYPGNFFLLWWCYLLQCDASKRNFVSADAILFGINYSKTLNSAYIFSF